MFFRSTRVIQVFDFGFTPVGLQGSTVRATMRLALTMLKFPEPQLAVISAAILYVGTLELYVLSA